MLEIYMKRWRDYMFVKQRDIFNEPLTSASESESTSGTPPSSDVDLETYEVLEKSELQQKATQNDECETCTQLWATQAKERTHSWATQASEHTHSWATQARERTESWPLATQSSVNTYPMTIQCSEDKTISPASESEYKDDDDEERALKEGIKGLRIKLGIYEARLHHLRMKKNLRNLQKDDEKDFIRMKERMKVSLLPSRSRFIREEMDREDKEESSSSEEESSNSNSTDEQSSNSSSSDESSSSGDSPGVIEGEYDELYSEDEETHSSSGDDEKNEENEEITGSKEMDNVHEEDKEGNRVEDGYENEDCTSVEEKKECVEDREEAHGEENVDGEKSGEKREIDNIDQGSNENERVEDGYESKEYGSLEEQECDEDSSEEDDDSDKEESIDENDAKKMAEADKGTQTDEDSTSVQEDSALDMLKALAESVVSSLFRFDEEQSPPRQKTSFH